MEKLLLVDDDKFMHKLVHKRLGSHYEILSAFDGAEGLTASEKYHPDIILLDVEMPGMNGYETCEKFKSNSALQNIPVIFLSGRSSTHARMLGYEVGADDFITKPFETHEIDAKIKVCLQYVQSRNDLEKQIKTVEQAATLAIADSSDFARLVGLTAGMFKVKTPAALADKIFHFCNSLQLNTSILITINEENKLFTSTGVMTPLEKELLGNMQNQKRFVDFGCRTVINYPGMSLLIKNMPLENATQYGRVKDLLPHLVEIALACTRSLELETNFISQSAVLGDTLKEVNGQIVVQIDEFRLRSETIENSLQKLNTEFSARIPSMGLDEDQEAYVLDTLSNTTYSISEQLEASSGLGDSLGGLSSALESIVFENRKLVEKLQAEQAELVKAIDDDCSDIELF